MSIWKRLAEPSTYAGIVGFLASLQFMGFTEAEWVVIFGAVSGAFSVLAIFLPEAGNAAGDQE